jgi:hypothetical protein
VTPLFDRYVMVDWSAEARPKTGKDSIWLACVSHEGQADTKPCNPSTRAAALRRIETILADALSEGRRVLLGFDFPLGYPQGFADRLGLGGPAWRAVWQEFAVLLTDDADNANNRFDMADTLNRRVSGGTFPFWGRPVARADLAALDPRHHRRHDLERLAERRLVDLRVRRSQPGWKLLGVGAAGGQALTGIPVLERLKCRFGDALRVWPFETGLVAPDESVRIVMTEIYPSLFPLEMAPDEVKDEAQTRITAGHFAALDRAGALAALFAGDPKLDDAERVAVVAEEGWVLGVTGPVTKGEDSSAVIPWMRPTMPGVGSATASISGAGVPPAGGRDAH